MHNRLRVYCIPVYGARGPLVGECRPLPKHTGGMCRKEGSGCDLNPRYCAIWHEAVNFVGASNHNTCVMKASQKCLNERQKLGTRNTISLTFSHSSFDILNNFCFHVYAQKSWFIGENCNAFFDHHHQQQQHPCL